MDLNRRLVEHNRGKTPFMKKGVPWIVVFSQVFDSRKEAIRLEKLIKARGAERFLLDSKEKNS